MWCKRCQQDVPGVPSHDPRKLVCLRCGGVMLNDSVPAPSAAARESAAVETAAAASTASATLPEWIDLGPWQDWRVACWEANHELDALGRSLKPQGKRRRTDRKSAQRPALKPRAASKSAAPAKAESHRRDAAPAASSGGQSLSGSVLSALASIVLAGSVGGFVCGVVLVGWGLLKHRDALSSLGTPIILSAQAALLAGLLLRAGARMLRKPIAAGIASASHANSPEHAKTLAEPRRAPLRATR